MRLWHEAKGGGGGGGGGEGKGEKGCWAEGESGEGRLDGSRGWDV